MRVSCQHRAAAARIRDDRRVGIKRRDVLSCKLSRTLEISGMCVQRATTDLICRRLQIKIIRLQHALGRAIHTRKESFTNTSLKHEHARNIPTFAPFFATLRLCARNSFRALEQRNRKLSPRRYQPATPVFNSKRANPRSRNNLDAPKKSRSRVGDDHTCRNTNRSSLLARSDLGCASSNTSRLASSSCPYSTPAGHTCSHARHPRQRSICVANAFDVFSSRPSATARIKYSRPRGPSFSFPVMT